MSHNPQSSSRITRQARNATRKGPPDRAYVMDGTDTIVVFGVEVEKAKLLVSDARAAHGTTSLVARDVVTNRTLAGRGGVATDRTGRTERRKALKAMSPADRRSHRAKWRAGVRALQDAHEARMVQERADRRSNKNKKQGGGETKKTKKAA